MTKTLFSRSAMNRVGCLKFRNALRHSREILRSVRIGPEPGQTESPGHCGTVCQFSLGNQTVTNKVNGSNGMGNAAAFIEPAAPLCKSLQAKRRLHEVKRGIRAELGTSVGTPERLVKR